MIQTLCLNLVVTLLWQTIGIEVSYDQWTGSNALFGSVKENMVYSKRVIVAGDNGYVKGTGNKDNIFFYIYQ